MPKVREDERRLMSLLRPLLELRAFFSGAVLLLVFILAVFKYYITWPVFGFIAVFIITVNYLSFHFIEKGVSMKAFMVVNGTIVTILFSIGVYYTGGYRSPFLVSYVILIILTTILADSWWITVFQTLLVMAAAAAVIILDMHDVINTKPFFLNVSFTIGGKESQLYTIILWGVVYAVSGFIFGATARVLGRVRREMNALNMENVHLQNIVKSLVSKTTWAEASEAARKSQNKLAERRVIRTIVFTDIVGFSSLSENISPEELVATLNLHFQEMGEIVYTYGGDIDKFIGDSIMAVFEDPVQAVGAAVEMQKTIARNNEEGVPSDPLTKVKIRIGINTGEVVIGNMGTSERTDRSLIGDAVNIAQRLESMANPGHILVSQATFKAVSGERYKFSSVGRVKIKGKKEIVRVYSLNPARQG